MGFEEALQNRVNELKATGISAWDCTWASGKNSTFLNLIAYWGLDKGTRLEL